MERNWVILIALMLLVSFLGVYISGISLTEIDPKIVPGDVAWMPPAGAECVQK